MEIILYDASWKKTEIPLEKPQVAPAAAPQPRVGLKKALNYLGGSLIIACLIFFALALGPIIKAELSYRLNTKGEVISQESKPDPTLAKEARRKLVAEEAARLGVDTSFSLVIPKINAATKIIPNVNPGDERAYRKALKEGVAHAAGTNFPGQGSNIFLFAHSALSPLDIANYNAVFYLIKELEPEDQIIIFFAGQKYLYQVTDKLIAAAENTHWLTENVNEERLVLQTCWPLGTTQKRLLVLAKKAE